jgi:hypothetical protein
LSPLAERARGELFLRAAGAGAGAAAGADLGGAGEEVGAGEEPEEEAFFLRVRTCLVGGGWGMSRPKGSASNGCTGWIGRQNVPWLLCCCGVGGSARELWRAG